MSKSLSLSLSLSTRQRGITDILLIALLAIVVLLAAGYFLFGQSFMSPVANLGKQIGLPIATPAGGDDVASLETEINSTEFSSIDSELTNLEKELDASLE